MLPTFVIGLREGLEASLIVGIIAAFLSKQGRRDLLRSVWIGVSVAAALCIAVGVALDIVSRDLPQKQQEGLETVVGALAVGMVTYMVVWMRRNSRELKGSLESAAAAAMEQGTSAAQRAGRAMVLMAFLAVLREGFETVVFLLAAFNESGSGSSAVIGAVLGIVLAIGLGYGIYRGGVRLNLSKFFRATGLVLVFVAAGLVLTAFHTAHEAGWLNAGQGSTVDLSWLVRPGTVQSSLLTGILGIQPHPVVIELVGWLVYLVPVGLYVAWPPGKGLAPRRLAALAAGGAVVTGVSAIVLAATAPSAPPQHPVTNLGTGTARVVTLGGPTTVQLPSAPGKPSATVDLHFVRTQNVDGLVALRYRGTIPGAVPLTVPGYGPFLTEARVAKLNGGRLPLGVTPTASGKIPVTYAASRTATVVIEPGTERVLDVIWHTTVTATARSGLGAIPLSTPVYQQTKTVPAGVTASAVAVAKHDAGRIDDRRSQRVVALWLLVATVGLMIVAGLAGLASRRTRRKSPATPVDTPIDRVLDTEVSLT